MTTYLLAPPPEAIIPVTRGCDRAFTVQHQPAGVVTDYPAGSSVTMSIATEPPTVLTATIERFNAHITIPSPVADLVRTGTRWRCILDLGGLELPLLVGTFRRCDG